MDTAPTRAMPPRPVQPFRLVAGLTAALLVYSVIELPPAWYVPGNLSAAALLWLGVRRAGLTAVDLGVDRLRARAGLQLGLVVAAGGVAVMAVGAALPFTRALFEDARVGNIGGGLLLYRMLVRIPLGTVILEELAFRGALFGAWQRWRGTSAAVVGSSLIFGLWHVRPALDLLDVNDLAPAGAERILAVVGAVVLTWLAGIFFCLLRLRGKGLIAPTVAHAVVNAAATLLAFWVS